MKAIVVTADNKVYKTDLQKPLYRSAGRIVGGLTECVRPMRMRRPYLFLCNESGLLRDLRINRVGSYLYGSDIHGNPIVGDLVFLKEGLDPESSEPDILGLTRDEASELYELLKDLADDFEVLQHA